MEPRNKEVDRRWVSESTAARAMLNTLDSLDAAGTFSVSRLRVLHNASEEATS
jgi:hypothetical protein